MCHLSSMSSFIPLGLGWHSHHRAILKESSRALKRNFCLLQKAKLTALHRTFQAAIVGMDGSWCSWMFMGLQNTINMDQRGLACRNNHHTQQTWSSIPVRTWVGGLKKDGPEQRNCSGLTTEAVCFADSVDFCTKKAEIRDLSLHGTRICGGFSWEPCHCGRSGQSSPALRRLTEHLPCLAGLVLTTKTRTRTTSVCSTSGMIWNMQDTACANMKTFTNLKSYQFVWRLCNMNRISILLHT